jgi:hypothetical protein
MFVWARELLDTKPSIANALRSRFPLVFIDEVQDNSELQSAMLHRLLFAGDKPSIRQRFGDSNQAIFQQDEEGAKTDPFPTSPKADLPNSHRFGKRIADAANPLGVNPQGLIGQGPCDPPAALGEPQNAIFVFDDATILSVLPAYAQHLMTSFTPEERASLHFSAVAAVHLSDDLDKIPRSIKHYVPDYDASISRSDCSPATLAQYLRSAQRGMAKCANTHPVVTKFAQGLVRLAQIANPTKAAPRRKSPHQWVLEMLEPFPALSTEYRRLIVQLIRSGGQPSSAFWSQQLRPAVVRIAAALAEQPIAGSRCADFLKWAEPTAGTQGSPTDRCVDNIFRYPVDIPEVQIHLGSVHSVKGETHAATLVLDSYFHKHHLHELKPWLLGTKQGGSKQADRMLKRLRLHYVAMTRPAHLLCLAMRSDALTEADQAALSARGWKVIPVHN